MSEPRGRARPVTSVLDVLRAQLDHESFDAVLFSLETVAADLGYGDIRALPGAIAWIERLRELGKHVGLFASRERVASALRLAGIDELFDEVTIGASTAQTLRTAIEATGVAAAERTVVVAPQPAPWLPRARPARSTSSASRAASRHRRSCARRAPTRSSPICSSWCALSPEFAAGQQLLSMPCSDDFSADCTRRLHVYFARIHIRE